MEQGGGRVPIGGGEGGQGVGEHLDKGVEVAG